MFKGLNESLNRAFRLLEDDDISADIDAVEVEDEYTDEVDDGFVENQDELIDDEEEMPEEESLEDKVDNLADRLEEIESILEINTQGGGDYEEEPEVTVHEKLSRKIRNDFRKCAKLSEDVEITEELIDSTASKNAYIPYIANKRMVSRDRVRNALLSK